MRMLYITAHTPWGKGEAFIITEMLEMKRMGVELLIIPRNPLKGLFHGEAKEISENAIWLPLVNFRMLVTCFKTFLTRAAPWKILRRIANQSRNPWIFIKNLMVFPKGIFIAEMLRNKDISHIHAHWGSTPSTMAYIISQLTGTPWSFTLHRWDIRENNMLAEKTRCANFTRCASAYCKAELINTIGDMNNKGAHVIIHMGVGIPEMPGELRASSGLFVIAVPANLLPVKGHEYLIEAISFLTRSGVENFRCIFFGEGPLRQRLKDLIKEEGLGNHIEMHGVIAHEKLLAMYRRKEIDLVILPSIITTQGEHEGIPVALMEAMAYGIPVISTNTGGIPELLAKGAGIIVEEKDPEQLAEAIGRLFTDASLRQRIGIEGYKRVKNEFDISSSAAMMLRLMTGRL